MQSVAMTTRTSSEKDREESVDGDDVSKNAPVSVGTVKLSVGSAEEVFYDAQEEERELYEDLRFETKNAGKWFSIAAIVVPTLTFAMSYPISIYVNNSKMHYPYYFLSSSIDHAPASCVGSFGLGTAAIIFFTWPIFRYISIKWAIANRSPYGRRVGIRMCGRLRFRSKAVRVLNNVSCCIGCLAAIGALGVASFQAHAQFEAHMTFAGIFFLSEADTSERKC